MPVDILVLVGRRLRYLRTTRGLSQDDLAAHAGISRNTLSRIENGKHDAGIHTMSALAKALGYKLVDLFKGLD